MMRISETMKMTVRVLLVLISIILPTAGFTAQTMCLTGCVVDQQGQPVPNAKVYAIYDKDYPPGFHQFTKVAVPTGPKGRYLFRNLPILDLNERYTLVAVTHNNLVGWGVAYTDANGKVNGAVYTIGRSKFSFQNNITVYGPSVFEGRVVDSSHNGLDGVRISVTGLKGQNGIGCSAKTLGTLMEFPSAVTDKDGYYRLEGIPGGAVPCIAPVKDGYHQTKLTYEQCLGPKEITLYKNLSRPPKASQMPTGSIAGRVVDEKGSPIAGARITAGGVNAISALDGSYKLTGILPYKYWVYYKGESEKVARGICNVQVYANRTVRVRDLVVTDGVILEGQLVDAQSSKPIGIHRAPDGKLSKPMVSIMHEGGNANLFVDSNGNFSTRVVPGKVTINYRGGHQLYPSEFYNGAYKPIYVIVSAKGLQDLRVKLKTGDVVHLKTVDDFGKPIRASVVVRTASGSVNGQSDEKGQVTVILPTETGETHNRLLFQYEFRPGDVIFEACAGLQALTYPYGTEPTNAASFHRIKRKSLVQGNNVIKLYKRKTLTVLVKDKFGKPLKDVRVALSSVYGPQTVREPIGMTDREGKVLLEGICFGRQYTMDVRLSGYYFGDKKRLPEVGSRNWTNTKVVVMTDAKRTQKGRVVDKYGIPVPDISVRTDFWAIARTDKNGEFSITDLPDCEVKLIATIGEPIYINAGEVIVSKSTEYAIIAMKDYSVRDDKRRKTEEQ